METISLREAHSRLAELVARTDQLIYLYPEFISFLVNATGGEAHVVLVEADGETVGALPFLVLTRAGAGRVVNSLPWYGSHGGCALDRTRPDAAAIRRALLAGFREAIAGDDLISSTVIVSHEEEGDRDEYVGILAPTATDERRGQITSLPPDPGRDGEQLMRVFKQKTRNLVRKSLKQGFEEKVSDDNDAWGALHRLHKENMAAIGGAAKPRAHFEALRQALPAPMRRLSLAIDGDTTVAAMLLLYGGSTVEYVTPAIDVRARPRQPLSFLIWRGMLDAMARGMRAWNWGGTWVDQHKLHHFKAGFGAKDRPYSYLISAPPLGLAFLNEHRQELGTLFPYFYTYPYAALDNTP